MDTERIRSHLERALREDADWLGTVLRAGGKLAPATALQRLQAALRIARLAHACDEAARCWQALARASRWGLNSQYLDQANDDVCLLVQAETRIALGQLDAICAVEGVDGVFIGPADLAASLGHRGNPTHPEVQAAIDNAIRTIVRSGKAAGILTGDVKLAKHYLALGARFVAVGIDVTLLAQSSRKLLQEFR